MTAKTKSAASTEAAKQVETKKEQPKVAVEAPKKPPMTTLTVYMGSTHYRFGFQIEKPNQWPVPIQTFIQAYRSGDEQLLWSPAANAPIQLIPARCIGWDARADIPMPPLPATGFRAVVVPNEAKPAEQKPAA